MESEQKLQFTPKATLDEFFVLKQLGYGQFGKVKLVCDQNNSFYAAKIIKVQGQDIQEEHLKMLEQETKFQGTLNHPNVVKIFDTRTNARYFKNGQEHKVMFILMEYVSSGSLLDYLFYEGPFEESIAKYYFIQMLQGLQAIHDQNISHRDLKPDNILFDKDGVIKITDFGLAAYSQSELQSFLNSFYVGTESYQAPELLLKVSYEGPTIDIYAIALTTFMMVVGAPAFQKCSITDA